MIEPFLIQQRIALQCRDNFELHTIALSAFMTAASAVTIMLDSSAL